MPARARARTPAAPAASAASRAGTRHRAARFERAQASRGRGGHVSAITRGTRTRCSMQLGDLAGLSRDLGGPVPMTTDEVAPKDELRATCRRANRRLPLDALQHGSADEFEARGARAVLPTVELDIEYERVLGYVQDDRGRRSLGGARLRAHGGVARGAPRSARSRSVRRTACAARAGAPRTRDTGPPRRAPLTDACIEALFGGPVDLELRVSRSRLGPARRSGARGSGRARSSLHARRARVTKAARHRRGVGTSGAHARRGRGRSHDGADLAVRRYS